MPGVTLTTNLSVLAATHNSLWCTPNYPDIAMQNLVVMRPFPASEEQAGREVGSSHVRLLEGSYTVLSRTCKG